MWPPVAWNGRRRVTGFIAATPRGSQVRQTVGRETAHRSVAGKRQCLRVCRYPRPDRTPSPVLAAPSAPASGNTPGLSGVPPRTPGAGVLRPAPVARACQREIPATCRLSPAVTVPENPHRNAGPPEHTVSRAFQGGHFVSDGRAFRFRWSVGKIFRNDNNRMAAAEIRNETKCKKTATQKSGSAANDTHKPSPPGRDP